MPRKPLLQTFRITHQYVGIFITPALLFFAFTGALQTFGLHETNRDHPNYKPAHWIAVLAQIHKKQVPTLPVRRAQPAPVSASPAADANPDHLHRHHPDDPGTIPPAAAQPAPLPAAQAAASQPAQTHHPLPLRIFFLIVSLGLFTSTLTGLYMSYNYVRNKTLVTATLLAGIIIPLVLLLV